MKRVNSFTWPIMVQVHCVIALKVLQKWKSSQHTSRLATRTVSILRLHFEKLA